MNLAQAAPARWCPCARKFSGLRGQPELTPLDSDLRHLFASWFNRGFLELRRIDWNTPAAVLEKLIVYEAVHEIEGWDDLRRRLAPDRRCFAFFHPALPGEPLIFVEVALVQGWPPRWSRCSRRTPIERRHGRSCGADTAIFYSISNCQEGLRGVSFGNFLIKQVVEELKEEFPQLSVSPRFAGAGLPPLARSTACNGGGPDAALLPELEATAGGRTRRSEKLRAPLLRLCARYLTRQPRYASTPWRAFTSAMARGSNGSTGSATSHHAASRNPSASWSTISTTTTPSRTTTRSLCVTGPSCVRPMSTLCSKPEPTLGGMTTGDKKAVNGDTTSKSQASGRHATRHSHLSLKEEIS